MLNCWLCGGWTFVDRRDTGETSWSDAAGGERGVHRPVYSLHMAPGIYEGELIPCPVCSGGCKHECPTCCHLWSAHYEDGERFGCTGSTASTNGCTTCTLGLVEIQAQPEAQHHWAVTPTK